MLRASWGQGFRAPSMTQLYSGTSQSFNAGVDARRCAMDPLGDPNTGKPTVPNSALPPGNPCKLTQYQNNQGGNPNLQAEESEQWSVGFVWNPLDDLSIAIDYFDIQLEDEIGLNSMQSLLDEEFRLAGGAPVAGGGTVGKVTRFQNGRIFFVDRTNANIAKRETDGLDIEGNYSFSVGGVGDFRSSVLWTHVNNYERDTADGRGLRDPDFFDPADRGSWSLNWALGDFSANLIWNYIASASIDSTGAALDDWSTWDVSVGYATPWNGLVTVGARNLFDEDPPTSPQIGSPFYSNYLHDVYGRVPYIRYEQDL